MVPDLSKGEKVPPQRVDDRLGGSKLHSGGSCGARQVRTPQICSGSWAEMLVASILGPFYPHRDRRADITDWQLCANERTHALQQKSKPYSITSSARARSAGGMVRPRSFRDAL